MEKVYAGVDMSFYLFTLKITNVIDCSLYSFLYKKFYLFFLYVRVMINLE